MQLWLLALDWRAIIYSHHSGSKLFNPTSRFQTLCLLSYLRPLDNLGSAWSCAWEEYKDFSTAALSLVQAKEWKRTHSTLSLKDITCRRPYVTHNYRVKHNHHIFFITFLRSVCLGASYKERRAEGQRLENGAVRATAELSSASLSTQQLYAVAALIVTKKGMSQYTLTTLANTDALALVLI